MTTCVYCGRDVYDSAVACPFCGYLDEPDEMTKQELLKLLNTPGIEAYRPTQGFSRPLKLNKSQVIGIVEYDSNETYTARLDGLKLIIGEWRMNYEETYIR